MAEPIKLDSDIEARMQRLADARRLPAERLVRDALEQYAKREEGREDFFRDGMAAWDAYRADGLHATEDEVDAWLAKLEAGDDVPPPECHV